MAFRPARVRPRAPTVLIADDHAVLLDGLCSLFERRGFRVVGQAQDGREAVRLARLARPDLAVLDVGAAKDVASRTQIEMLGAALDAYRLDNGGYPTTEQGLAALWQQPPAGPRPGNWRGPYLRKTVPLDPWGRPYVYRSPGEVNQTTYDLLSYGADGQPGGEGEAADITSWQ